MKDVDEKAGDPSVTMIDLEKKSVFSNTFVSVKEELCALIMSRLSR